MEPSVRAPGEMARPPAGRKVPAHSAESVVSTGGGNTRRVIYVVMVDLIAERGYHGTSLRVVAERVGIQMASLYYHFPSKQAVLVEIMMTTLDDLTRQTTAAAQGAGSDPVERLRAAIRSHVIFHAERRREAFITDSELRSLDGPNLTRVTAARDWYESVFADILRAGVASNLLMVPDLRLALNALLAMCTEVAVWYRSGGRLSLADIANVYCSLFLQGVLRTGDAQGPNS